jgi:CheY-like chemotaxis protein
MRSETVTPRVLIADDQPDVLEALRWLLTGEGYRIESAGSPAAIPRRSTPTDSTRC